MNTIRHVTIGLLSLVVTTASFGAGFTAGNLAVLQCDNASANNTTFSILELNPALTGQTSTVSSNGINGTTMPNALRQTGSATSSPFLADTDDGTLLAFTGFNTNGVIGNINTNTWRGVGTLDPSGNFTLQTIYKGSGSGGNQTRGATSTNNTVWIVGDQNGIYTNNAASVLVSANPRAAKSFGGTVYFCRSSSTCAVSRLSGSTLTVLPGLTSGAPTNATDFYMISSGSNGSTFDVLYILDNNASTTAGSIFKYSLVGGTWTVNGSAVATGVGGFGLCAAKNGSGANLFFTSGTGATASNKVYEVSDANGYNQALSLGANTLLYSVAATPTLKGIAFVPVQAGSGPTVSFGTTGTVTQTEGNVPVTVNLQLSSAVTGSVSVTSIGSAAQDVRFFLSQTNFTFDGVTTSQTLTITLIDDAIAEPAQVVRLALTNATGFTIGTISNFAFALFDNDQPTIQFDSSGTADVPENGGPVSVNVQISQAADATVQVASVGNAAPGSDFTLSATQFIFTAAGPISQALTVTLIDDTIPEPTESVSLNLVAPAGAGLGLATNFTFNLLDNEPSVQFTKSSATVSEGDGTYQLVVFKSSTNNTVTGNIAVGGTAQPGADFTLSATNFTLAGATTSATITVTLVDDSVAEADETATFTLSDVSAASVGSPAAFTLTILDNDPPAQLSAGDIALIGRINNGTPDSYAFVALTNLTPGQLIYFTDNGWNNTMFRGAASSGNGGEDIVKLTVVAEIPAGTIIQSTNTGGASWLWDSSSAIPGTNSNFKTLSLSQSGDQVYIFTAPRLSPLQNPATHIFVFDDTHGFEPGLDTPAGDIPPGLSSNANTALSFSFASSGFAALNMNNAALQSFTKQQWLAYIGNVTNWVTDASATNQLPSGSLAVVNPGTPPSGYDLWAAAITNGLTNYSASAAGDSYPNLLKYATGSNPTNSDGLASMSGSLVGGILTFRFYRNTNAVDVTLIVEGAYDVTDGAPWSGIATNTAGIWSGPAAVQESPGESPLTVTVTDTDATATNRYLRLRVTKP